MKQFITGEQIYKEKMTFDKFEELRELLGMANGMFGERCSIGKMLEILESKSNYTQQLIHEGGRYCVSINPKQGYTTAWETEYYNEPCDALWEAVKHVL
jgi:hypothetical protein